MDFMIKMSYDIQSLSLKNYNIYNMHSLRVRIVTVGHKLSPTSLKSEFSASHFVFIL